MNEKSKFKSVVSFRITEDEKKALDKMIHVLSTNKSEFLRKKLQLLIVSIKNNNDPLKIT